MLTQGPASEGGSLLPWASQNANSGRKAFPMPADERLTLSVKEAALELGLCERTLRNLIAQGRIPAIRISDRRVIIPRRALEEYLDRCGR